MAIAPVQHTSQQTTGNNALAYGTNIGASGRVLLAAVFWNNNADLTSMSDSRNGAWTPIGSRKACAGTLAGWSFQMFCMLAPAAGATTVTAVPSTSVSCGMVIHEFSGFTGTPTITGTPVYDNLNGNTLTTSALTTTVATALLFAAMFPENTMTSISAPFTDQAPSGDGGWGGGDYGYEVVSTIQTGVTCSFVNNFSDVTSGFVAIGDSGSTTNPKTLSATEGQTATVARQDGKPLAATQAETGTVKRVVSKVLVP